MLRISHRRFWNKPSVNSKKNVSYDIFLALRESPWYRNSFVTKGRGSLLQRHPWTPWTYGIPSFCNDRVYFHAQWIKSCNDFMKFWALAGGRYSWKKPRNKFYPTTTATRHFGRINKRLSILYWPAKMLSCWCPPAAGNRYATRSHQSCWTASAWSCHPWSPWCRTRLKRWGKTVFGQRF